MPQSTSQGRPSAKDATGREPHGTVTMRKRARPENDVADRLWFRVLATLL